MGCVKFSIWVVVASLLVLSVHGRGESAKGTTASKEMNGVEVDVPSNDQLTSGTVTAKEIIPDSEAVAATTSNAKGDLKSADSFGLGYYLPIVTPIVKYHYPLFYYHPATYIHSIRHHGYGGYGFYQHGQYGHGVLH